ncbi:MAG: hypothetical protein HN636_04200 [Cryomorphaceae bacterium]|jgi:hypothetical protein|nr:hypothetical protein [Candidatus Neomarinimicrobiota bacterium]MBT5772200.1 hypothetical protein [Flavobacteriaceae bacterium]MBT7683642.1 hypothetical protein [Cryomorphaceae bacterium]MBT5097169.1 hypothetical protein [Candidatus Neomarinimicrobiota bacterium]MBT6689133.1 hypothetical protein [Flavobacteriaceae bacterium]
MFAYFYTLLAFGIIYFGFKSLNDLEDKKYYRISIFLTIAIFALITYELGFAKSPGWSPTEKSEFIESCVDGASGSMTRSEASKYCNCVLNDLMEDYDTPEDALNVDVFSYAIECL